MGVVYKAEDEKLKRPVALKFLPIELTRDETAKKRLIREAQAISALQHHNICTIHEIDQSDDGRLFICMDYYEGETLKDRLARGPLSAEEAIDVVTQVARGLEEAHRRGIVHRDIKPANVVITNQGVVKILDFGLAKLGGETKLTKTGSTVGTAAYMSPEQVRGEEIDQRSDIFSLGVVFHEALTGASPFSAEHEPAVMHKILNVAPPSLRTSGVKRAAQLEPVVGRMLSKDPALRYASTSEVVDDLKRALHDAPGTRRRSAAVTQRVVAAIVVVGLGVGAWFFGSKRPWQHRELHQRQLTSNPANDPVGTGVISPDGKTLAVVDHFHPGLSLRAIDSGESHTVDLPEGFAFSLLIPLVDWFPDGSQLLVSGNMSDGTPCVWAVPVAGGRARKLRGDGDGAMISRDGSQLAYIRTGETGPELWCAGIDGQNPHRVATSDSTGMITTWAAWSPNGSRVAYARAREGSGGTQVLIESCDLDGNRRRIFSSSPEQTLHVYTVLLWTRDGRLLFGMTDPPPDQRDMNLWSLHVDPSSGAPSGKPQRITRWQRLSAVWPTGISSDGKRLSVSLLEYQGDCYIGRIARGDSLLQGVTRLTLDDRMDLEPAWLPDGKSILFSSDRNSTSDIFKQSLQATGAEPVVTGPGDQSGPLVSPDGAWILYLDVAGTNDHDANQTARLMRVPIDGGPAEKVFDTQPVAQFRCARAPASLCVVSTRDGAETVFNAFEPLHGLGRELTRVPAESGPTYWDLSSDGTDMAFVASVMPPVIRTVSLRDGATHDVAITAPIGIEYVAWNADGTGWVVVGIKPDEKAWNLYRVAPDGGTTKLLPPQMWMYGLAASPDGRRVAFTTNTVDGNVWLLEGF